MKNILKIHIILLLFIVTGFKAKSQTWFEYQMDGVTGALPAVTASGTIYADPNDSSWRRGYTGIGTTTWPNTRLQVNHGDLNNATVVSYISGLPSAPAPNQFATVISNSNHLGTFTGGLYTLALDTAHTIDHLYGITGLAVKIGSGHTTEMIGVGASTVGDNDNNNSGPSSQAMDALASGNHWWELYGAHGTASGGNSFDCVGVKGDASGDNNSNGNFGVQGKAITTTTSSRNIGTYGVACGSSVFNAGVYGDYCGSDTSKWAGYFNGKVYSTTSFIVSDQTLKTNIEKIKAMVLPRLKQLSGYTYEFKTDHPNFNFPTGKQYGVIAQELEKVFPEAVLNSVLSAGGEGEVPEILKVKTVNYNALIPVLIQSVKELDEKIEAVTNYTETQQKIDELSRKLAEYQNLVSDICNNGCDKFKVPASGPNTDGTTGPALYQNTPNPFNAETVIKFYIPSNGFENAYLTITNLSGTEVQKLAISSSEQTQLTISGRQLSAGTYYYTLYVNGKAVDSKKMILTSD